MSKNIEEKLTTLFIKLDITPLNLAILRIAQDTGTVIPTMVRSELISRYGHEITLSAVNGILCRMTKNGTLSNTRYKGPKRKNRGGNPLREYSLTKTSRYILTKFDDLYPDLG